MLTTELVNNKINGFLKYRMHEEVCFLSAEDHTDFNFLFFLNRLDFT